MTTPADVLVLVGTDHHRFDRLVSWVDAWAARTGHGERVLVQHGSAAAPRHARAARLLEHTDVQQLLSSAVVVVCHGGPSTIAEARRLGRMPVVLPRDPAHREHVDRHQLLFAERLGHERLVHLVRDERQLVEHLDTALEHPSLYRVAVPLDDPRTASSRRLGEAVDQLLAGRAGTRRPRGSGDRRGPGPRWTRPRDVPPPGP